RVEFPEERSGFRYPELLKHVREHRAELVVAALTVLTAYNEAGRPNHGETPMGSFESWDHLIRGACVWVGLKDPCAGRERIRAEGDHDLEAIRAVFTTWHEAFGSEGMTVAQVRAMAERGKDPHGREGDLVDPELHGALAALDARGDGCKLN